ncbi:uncharacterized protein E0L32_009946 [Thyridium curvatum]|uniref:DnaJ homologue subfamily C member 28 conserved domain-containing protein n=1 Tax=Thyridium curvatum TaxID=1093900 RepID=A0A507AMW0_9PEZI|nr:uncharacterized protein E0L32_009946 [Thyridium curvatum]TPX08607.1 hypothetical protein E0L32_009946 [Thyridium curvatum]
MSSYRTVCRRCARALDQRSTRHLAAPLVRHYSDQSSPKPPSPVTDQPDNGPEATGSEPGPMARRLEEATEEALLTGGRAGRRAVEDAGFSDELKQRLLNRIADANFRADHSEALNAAGIDPNTMQSSIPASAGEGTRAAATARAWTGEEATEDAVLRMLDDARKQLRPELRGKPKLPDLAPVDMRLRGQSSASPGRKVAAARDRASSYVGMGLGAGASVGIGKQGKGLTDKEREELRQEFRERFQPGARAMPNTITGLAALANERIEDAIARGQFKDIPRGKGIERDARADNPFIDTTEYIMNKMIKRQDIVPPWIEKQQELVKAAGIFRARLRNDWKRHVARMIASKGGSLEEQMRRAEDHARAEEVHNPRRRNVDEIAVPTSSTDDPVMVKMRAQGLALEPDADGGVSSDANTAGEEGKEASGEPHISVVKPFRDPDWEAAERSYMELAVAYLNTMTRSYNLLAPDLAKKPYFSLDRELKACFADVAPQVADKIRERATRPARSFVEPVGSGTSILDKFGGPATRARVHDSKTPNYGFKEMWRDLWSRPDHQ